jgi:hypothetical protein
MGASRPSTRKSAAVAAESVASPRASLPTMLTRNGSTFYAVKRLLIERQKDAA